MPPFVAVELTEEQSELLGQAALLQSVNVSDLARRYVEEGLRGSGVARKGIWKREDRVELDRATAARARSIGAIGEILAMELLRRSGFTDVEDLNALQTHHPYADIFAVRGADRYFISVKSRNKYQWDGTLNRSYKIGPSERSHAAELEALHDGSHAAWVAIIFDIAQGSYSSYFGKLTDLEGRHGIKVTPEVLMGYECLAQNEPIPPEYSMSELRNVFRRRGPPSEQRGADPRNV